MTLRSLLASISPICCFVAAAALALKEIDGWGLFLAVGLLVTPITTLKTND